MYIYFLDSLIKIKCPILQNPEHGLVVQDHKIARYSCLSNRRLVGPAYRECTINGTWTFYKPTCAGNYAVPISLIKNNLKLTYFLGFVFRPPHISIMLLYVLLFTMAIKNYWFITITLLLKKAKLTLFEIQFKRLIIV